MKVVIMAGGKGTRISSVVSDIPKPMIKIEGIPVLEREIECLKEQGFDDILITVSHLGNIIMDYFGDGSGNSPVTGQPFGVHICQGNTAFDNQKNRKAVRCRSFLQRCSWYFLFRNLNYLPMRTNRLWLRKR